MPVTYFIVETTPEDLSRIVPYIPKRYLEDFSAEQYLRMTALPPGFSVVYSPFGHPIGCTVLGTYPREEDALAFAGSHVPDLNPVFGLPVNIPSGKRIRRESGRPIKYSKCSQDLSRWVTDRCDRCDKKMNQVYNLSWFTPQTLCTECRSQDDAVRQAAFNAGIEDGMEGCGYLPMLSSLVAKNMFSGEPC